MRSTRGCLPCRIVSDGPLEIDRPAELSPAESVIRLVGDDSALWPVMTVDPEVKETDVVPVRSAVIIARRLDLTNQTLEIEPAVGTLYIIAEEIDAASGAMITWTRPRLATPNIGPDPSLNGRSWTGTQTASGSRTGLPGGDARGGAPGLPGYPGRDAPSVEFWALRFNGMPDVDPEGQRGGSGGNGQQGGRGGRGARRAPAKELWPFGKCVKDPGDGGPGGHGGDGGDGGDGGRGGRGGTGGDAGDILFAVLEETLVELTTTNPFTLNLGAGDAGRGGEGGRRGEGGPGGTRGPAGPCKGGRSGARGQPGRAGPRGAAGRPGTAGG